MSDLVTEPREPFIPVSTNSNISAIGEESIQQSAVDTVLLDSNFQTKSSFPYGSKRHST